MLIIALAKARQCIKDKRGSPLHGSLSYVFILSSLFCFVGLIAELKEESVLLHQLPQIVIRSDISSILYAYNIANLISFDLGITQGITSVLLVRIIQSHSGLECRTWIIYSIDRKYQRFSVKLRTQLRRGFQVVDTGWFNGNFCSGSQITKISLRRTPCVYVVWAGNQCVEWSILLSQLVAHMLGSESCARWVRIHEAPLCTIILITVSSLLYRFVGVKTAELNAVSCPLCRFARLPDCIAGAAKDCFKV